eukprot:10146360-Lingulodinium_polyedra.AAC.1
MKTTQVVWLGCQGHGTSTLWTNILGPGFFCWACVQKVCFLATEVDFSRVSPEFHSLRAWGLLF